MNPPNIESAIDAVHRLATVAIGAGNQQDADLAIYAALTLSSYVKLAERASEAMSLASEEIVRLRGEAETRQGKRLLAVESLEKENTALKEALAAVANAIDMGYPKMASVVARKFSTGEINNA